MSQTEERTEQVYQFIAEQWRQHRHVPSIREIAAACKMGNATVILKLDLLEAEGRIVRERYKSRSIRLVEDMHAEDEIADQVYDLLLEAYAEGEIPTQNELAQSAYISRRRVAQALQWLAGQGLIEIGAGQRNIRLLDPQLE